MNTRCRLWRFSILAALGAVWVWLGATLPSNAHWADLAAANITIEATQAHVVLTLPTGIVEFADTNRDGQLSVSEIQAAQSTLETFIGDRVQFRDREGEAAKVSILPNPTLPPSTTMHQRSVGTTAQHSTLNLRYTWAHPSENLTLSYRLFAPGINTAQCLATLFANGKSRTVVFTPDQPELVLNAAPLWQQFASFISLGIEHILTGYDHILFLISLLMLGGGLQYLLKIVTAFTISHSITLSLAVLEVVSIPSRVVEAAIALTIVYVAAENFWRQDVKGRWRLTFLFGLIHGFGFASILREMHVARSQLALALGGFNLGVEIGQALVVICIFTGFTLLGKRTWLKTLRLIISGSVVAMGLVWFAERTFWA